MLPDALGKFLQFALLEGLAGVGGGLVNGADGKELECAAILHDALLGLGLVVKLWSAHAALYPLRWRGAWV